MQMQENIALARYTTLKVGGTGRFVAHVGTLAGFEQARLFAVQIDAPVLVLGHGSNVLISDQGYAGVVIINQILSRSYQEGEDGTIQATFGAGENFDEVVADTVSRGYWGLENLSHIPGTVGATPIQNVGAYGVEVANLIVGVQAVSLITGEQKEFSNQDCQFGYRDSFFKTQSGREWMITHVTYRLTTSEQSAVLGYADLKTFAEKTNILSAQNIRQEIIRIRSEKFPDWQQIGTAGSFFKNPTISQSKLTSLLEKYPELPHYPQPDSSVKVSLGWILDKICGLRGYSDGDVSLSKHQALVLLNRGESAAAITDFVAQVTDEVYQKTQIAIEPEVRIL